MPRFQSSIVIPVFNKWDLTRICLKSLAATTDRAKVEVIVVDNASSDVTPQVCPALGQKLFGDSFRYIRNEQNRNFAGASNQGASAAAGEYLVFLNNDTEALPGWYEPLINDFSRFANIAATGPVLLYPKDKIFGHTVQHLGVLVSPFFKLGHLYAGIPAESPLAKKRRFFQIITAACMVMPRSIFMEAGMFDEAFINGFEDVDLCARLFHKGYRMTVNPESHVIHYEGQSQGRHDNDDWNGKYLEEKSFSSMVSPDWHLYLKNDGLSLKITEWLSLAEGMNPDLSRRIDPLARTTDREQLIEMLKVYPFWEQGLLALAEKSENWLDKRNLMQKKFRLNGNPDYLLKIIENAARNKDQSTLKSCMATLESSFCSPASEFMRDARTIGKWLEKIGMTEMVVQCEEWLANYPEFEKQHAQFIAKYNALKKTQENRR